MWAPEGTASLHARLVREPSDGQGPTPRRAEHWLARSCSCHLLAALTIDNARLVV